MKVLIVSALGETLGLALRLMNEHHEVRMYIHAPTEQTVGAELVQKVPNWRGSVAWADLVIFDDVEQKVENTVPYGGGRWAQSIRRGGKPVIGGSPLTDRLENDRIYANDVFRRVGMDIAPMTRFTNFDQAKRFVEQTQGAYALKHNGQVDRNLAGVFWKPEDMIEFLEYLQYVWPHAAHGLTPDFVLQEAVKGVEIAVTTPFAKHHFWNQMSYLNQELKKTMDNDEGPSSGQAGEFGVVQNSPRVFKQSLGLLDMVLAQEGVSMFFDINCICTENRAVPLEATARFGYPTFWTFLESLGPDASVGDFLLAMANGESPTATSTDSFVANCVVASGTFPDPDEEKNKFLVLKGWEKTGLDHVWLNEVQWANDRLESAGTNGYLAVVTQNGPTIEDTKKVLYETVDLLSVVPFRKVRRDIGKKFEEDFPKLRAWRWAN